jgi:hypothetical protein
VTAVTADTKAQLAWEAKQRPRAGIAAIAAAILSLGSIFATQAILADAPHAYLLDSLQQLAAPGPIGTQESIRTPVWEFYDDRSVPFILTSLARGVGYLGIGLALAFLAMATRARRPEMPKIALYAALVGAVLAGLAFVMSSVSTIVAFSSFLDGPHTVNRAQDALESPATAAAQLIGFPGAMALAIGFVLICLNAMRAGLLPRFMGVLGIITGVLIFIPLGSLPVIQAFWLGALGALLLGTWPGGVPAAWTTGRAEVVPSGAEVRRQRMEEARAAKAEPKRRPRADEDDDDPAPPAVRRKRKRRN